MKSFPITTSDLSAMLSITPQRILALSSDLGLTPNDVESKGKFKYYSPSGVRKLLDRRGIYSDSQKVIAFCNNKGGVGKSSTAANTAIMLSSLGYKTLLIDSDGQANTTSFFLPEQETFCLMEILNGKKSINDSIVELNPNLFILPSNLNNQKLSNYLSGTPNKNTLKKLISNLDYEFIIWDCNPSLDSTNQQIYFSCTDILIVTLMEAWSLAGVEMTKELLIELFDGNGRFPNVNVLINKLDGRIGSQVNLYSKLEQVGLDVFPITIETDNSIPKSQNEGFTITNKNKSFKTYQALAMALIQNKNLTTQSDLSLNQPSEISI